MTTASQALCTTPAPCPIYFTAAAKISLDISQITSPFAASHISMVRAPSPPQPPGFLPSAQPPFLPFSSCSLLSSFLPQVLCMAASFGMPRVPRVFQAGSCWFLLNIQISIQATSSEKPSRPDSQYLPTPPFIFLITSLCIFFFLCIDSVVGCVSLTQT